VALQLPGDTVWGPAAENFWLTGAAVRRGRCIAFAAVALHSRIRRDRILPDYRRKVAGFVIMLCFNIFGDLRAAIALFGT
jgi:hypothetical protein